MFLILFKMWTPKTTLKNGAKLKSQMSKKKNEIK
jgi:hypothetical protein